MLRARPIYRPEPRSSNDLSGERVTGLRRLALQYKVGGPVSNCSRKTNGSRGGAASRRGFRVRRDTESGRIVDFLREAPPPPGPLDTPPAPTEGSRLRYSEA